MSGKKSSIIYHDLLSVVDEMPDEMAGKFVKSLLALMQNKDIDHQDFSLKIALHPFIAQFKRDNDKYQRICDRNKANGVKGGRPKKPDNPAGLSRTQNNPENHDTDNDNDNGNDTGTKKKKISRFTPPTIQEVKDYCLKRNNKVDPVKFVNHYQAVNWMRGKNKIKDWKACVHTWENNDGKGSGRKSSAGVGFTDASRDGKKDYLEGLY